MPSSGRKLEQETFWTSEWRDQHALLSKLRTARPGNCGHARCRPGHRSPSYVGKHRATSKEATKDEMVLPCRSPVGRKQSSLYSQWARTDQRQDLHAQRDIRKLGLS